MAKYEYQPSMAAKIIELSKKGYLKCEIAAELNVPSHVISLWKKQYDEFKELMELCETYSMAWWCMRGRTNLDNCKFNFYLWYSIMRNAYGWADKPTERNIEFEDWKGDFVEKINNLDYQLSIGKVSTEMYEKMMRSLSVHANINEIVYVQPQLCKMELAKQLESGEIDQDEHDVKLLYLERMDQLRKVAAESVLKSDKHYSEYNSKQSRKTTRMSKAEKLEQSKIEIKEKPVDPVGMLTKAQKMVKKRREKLRINETED